MFSFSGFNMFHFMHSAPMAVLAHLPWLLTANDILLCTTNRRKRTLAQLAVSLLTASQCLLGHPQFLLFSLIAESGFTFIRIDSWANKLRLLNLTAAKLLGGIIGAIQLIPLWDYVNASTRSDASLDFRLTFSLHPMNVLQLWSPFAFKERYYAITRVVDGNTHEMGLYMVAVCSISFAWLGIRWHKMRNKRLVTFLLFALLFALVLSFWPVWQSISNAYSASTHSTLCFSLSHSFYYTCASGAKHSYLFGIRRFCLHG